MYDFLYTLGVGIIRPTLLTAVKAVPPVFDRVRRTIVESNLQGAQIWTSSGSPQAGTLDQNATESVRVAIAKFVKGYSAAAPPIGIYTAGRFCQLATIEYFESESPDDSSFEDILDLFHKGYLEAIGSGLESSLHTFPAFLGAMSMDSSMIFDFSHPTPKLDQVLSEFGIVRGGSREWDIASAFARSNGFVKAAGFFLEGDSDPWEDTSSADAYYWWDDEHTKHAIP